MKAPTIYLDSAATTPLDPSVREAMLPFLEDNFANPSSVHPLGQKVRRAVEDARERAAAVLGGEPAGLVFTSGATESNNTVLRGLARKGKRIIITRLEHPSAARPAAYLSGLGFEVAEAANDSSGRIDLGHLADLLREKPASLLCVIHGSNEVGVIQDLDAIGAVVREISPRTWLHTDAVQTVGYVPLHPQRWRIDSLSVSAHKIFGPKGAGALMLYGGRSPEPLIHGGGQERNLRSGTENPSAIAGLATALDACARHRTERADHAARLRDRMQEVITNEISDACINGAAGERLPHILSVSFAGFPGEVLLHHLETEGVMVSTGSACHSAEAGASEVIRALGVPARLAGGTIRISFSHRNTDDEIERAAAALKRQVVQLREVGSQ